MLAAVKWETTATVSQRTKLALHGVLMALAATRYKRDGSPGPNR